MPAKRGRPRIPKSRKKVQKSIGLRKDEWKKLESVEENPSRAISKLIEHMKGE